MQAVEWIQYLPWEHQMTQSVISIYSHSTIPAQDVTTIELIWAGGGGCDRRCLGFHRRSPNMRLGRVWRARLSSLPLYNGEQFDSPLDTRGNKDKEYCYRPELQNLPLAMDGKASKYSFFSTVKTTDCFYYT